MKKVTLLFSPGLDSFLSDWLISTQDEEMKVTRLYFDIGSRYSEYEIQFLKEWYPKDHIHIIPSLNMSDLEQENAFIPNRNAILASLAQSITGDDTIILNATLDDRVSDGSIEFRKTLSEALSVSSEKDITVTSFLESREKSDWVRMFSVENPTKKLDLLNKTYSCYNKTLFEENDLPCFNKTDDGYEEFGKYTVYGCGECLACYRRLCALTAANIYVPFYDFKIVEKYIRDGNVQPETYPSRFITIQNYYSFMRWFGCD